ncbi:MAG: endonuclease/exonuclease/phosphatase family protein [Halieaceae bacterium]|jgi:endonuclease/exonuclease/phosphatase (EEP) superfamily protein YafD
MSSRSAVPRGADQRLSLRIIAVALLSVWVSNGHAAEKWPRTISSEGSGACAQALSLGRQQVRKDGLRTPFSLLNWNVEKAQHPSLVAEFEALAKRSDLIFLQEAVPLKKTDAVIEQSLYEAFVPGYVQNEIATGVLTLARIPHLVHCHLLATEPWLRTPKATSVTLYPMAERNASLLTVNLHAVNFSFGVKAYRAQLEAAAELIRGHKGPVIFGGDLNTWSGRRQSTLDALTADLELTPIVFSPDHRTTRFGRPLDHLYVRGLARQSSETLQVVTSDHNPLITTLALEAP